jgi:hypothetical protein
MSKPARARCSPSRARLRRRDPLAQLERLIARIHRQVKQLAQLAQQADRVNRTEVAGWQSS